MKEKKFLFIVLFLFLIVAIMLMLLFVKPVSAQVYTSEPYAKVETQCKFCGKNISKTTTIIFNNDNDDYYQSFDWKSNLLTYTPDSSRIHVISIQYMLEVCEKCYHLYNKALSEEIAWRWEQMIEPILKDNEKLRQHHEMLREKRKTAKLKKEIKKLEEQLKKMKYEVKHE